MLDYGSEEFFDMTPKSFHSPQHTFAVYFSLLHSPPVSDTVAKYQQMHRASASSTVIREWELLVRRKKEWMNGWIFFVWWLTAESMNGNFMETFFYISFCFQSAEMYSKKCFQVNRQRFYFELHCFCFPLTSPSSSFSKPAVQSQLKEIEVHFSFRKLGFINFYGI